MSSGPTERLIDFREIDYTTDDWELFSRDLLQSIGMHVESPPSRGADHGKDLLVSETLPGRIANMRLRWLVSCKHFATSGKSVNEAEEPNILERIRGFQADGFIGVYSTIASSGLNHRLEQLRTSGDIKDFRILDHREIENRLVTGGYSSLLMRYFPESYRRTRPIHLFSEEYIPLPCAQCGVDLLEQLFHKGPHGMVVFLSYRDENQSVVTKAMCCCKGTCDRKLMSSIRGDQNDTWCDLSDLAVPFTFMEQVLSTMASIHTGSKRFTNSAFQEFTDIVIALAQKTLRPISEEEWARIMRLRSFRP